MGIFERYKINKAVQRLAGATAVTSPEAVQAAALLQRCDATSTILKLLEALGKGPPSRALLAVLEAYAQDETLALLSEGLASTNTRVAAAVGDVLTQAQTYDPNRLFDYWNDPHISKATLSKIIVAHAKRVDVHKLLSCLEAARPEERQALFSVLVQRVTPDSVPALVKSLATPDDTFRLGLTRLIVRFETEDVPRACLDLLRDSQAAIRQTALEGLRRPEFPIDVAPICALLQDPEPTVRRQAAALLGQRKDPQTVGHVLALLPGADAEMRQGLLPILQAVGTADAMKVAVLAPDAPAQMPEVLLSLLPEASVRIRNLALVGIAHLREPCDVEPLCRLLTDADATVRRQAAAVLVRQNDPRILPYLLPLLQDTSPDIQSNAVAIFNGQSTPAALQTLLEPLQGHDEDVSTRVAEALGQHGTAQVIDAALQLALHTTAFLRRCAVNILKQTRDDRIWPFLSSMLEQENAWRRTCAAEALAALGEQRAVPALIRLVEHGEEAERLTALCALSTLGDARAVPVCLTQVQQGAPALQQEALRALARLTDTAQAEQVFQVVTIVRAMATDPALQVLVTNTVETLIQRFGTTITGDSDTSETTADLLQYPPPLAEFSQHEEVQTDISLDGMRRPPTASSETAITGTVSDIMAVEPGTVLGERYRILRHIGQGGFGTVVLVEDLMVQEEVILKFLHPHMANDARMIARFVHELRYARRVTHENVIRIHEFLKIDGLYAISMEYFPSHNLSDALAQQAPLPLPYGLRIVWHVCRGMHAAHQANVLHRDLKPPNILLDDKRLVKIVDFGLAALTNDAATRLTRTGALMGTPLYMAPELLQNRTLDARLDIYSLGVIMYEIFTGAPPYEGDNPMAILFQHVAGKATPPREVNPEIPPGLEAIIQQAMAVEPAQRFQTMEALAKQLAPLLKQYGR